MPSQILFVYFIRGVGIPANIIMQYEGLFENFQSVLQRLSMIVNFKHLYVLN